MRQIAEPNPKATEAVGAFIEFLTLSFDDDVSIEDVVEARDRLYECDTKVVIDNLCGLFVGVIGWLHENFAEQDEDFTAERLIQKLAVAGHATAQGFDVMGVTDDDPEVMF